MAVVNRKQIEQMIYDVFDALDPSGSNTNKYRNIFSTMEDKEFEKYMKEFLADEEENFILDIIEFDLNYFNKIMSKNDKAAAIENYPRKIRLAYDKFLRGELKDSWIELTPSEGALCFYYYEPIPLFISSIPSILKLEEAQSREAKRDENELYKILVQKL